MDRIMIGLLCGILGFVLGALTPVLQTQTQDGPVPPTSTPTEVIIIPKPGGTVQVPPTLQPAPTPARVPAVPTLPGPHTFVIPLAGGGEMKVVATDYDSAINNVKSSGGTPAEGP